MIILKLSCLFLILKLSSCSSNNTKLKVTFDEFFDYTTYPLLSFSPNGKYLLVQTRYPLWKNNSFEDSLWIYNLNTQIKTLVIKNLHPSIKPKWSPSGNYIGLFLKNDTLTNVEKTRSQYFYIYSILSMKFLSINIGNEIPLVFTWSNNDSSIYLVTIPNKITNDDQWKDVIQFRKDIRNQINRIYQIDFNETINFIGNVSFLINEFIYVSSVEKLVFTSTKNIIDNIEDIELYSMDLRNSSFISKLTENEAFEEDLQLSYDGKEILYRILPLRSTKRKSNDTQARLYSINLFNGQMHQIGENFHGNIVGYASKSDGNILILGQLGTEVHIYTQQLSRKNLIHHNGWNGTYASLVISNNNNDLIGFVHSSFNKPMEVYLSDNMNQLQLAQAITDENQLFTQRDLAQGTVYTWINKDDGQTIEGILHYPPGEYQRKNLPLLVLIHGGPYLASINHLNHNGGYWAPLAASQGWLVLEPNYRGSTGYGDEFFNQIRQRPLTLPGKDILYGVDSLIRDEIVDSRKLAVGGYSYGGFLTNWLITQTKRFNVALSAAGATDHASTWGTLDMPILIENIFGGFPWDVPHLYQEESPIYHLDLVRTPTHIVTGDNDVRVPASQSYLLERGLYYRNIPVELLLLPNEGHSLSNNPWHHKIKVREELKWLHKYGYGS
ncbi:hypothetical protein I4U23_022954 [Adineta vaga]|nr:hypothetical protein I4U23_022954 [Adineta vaga]